MPLSTFLARIDFQVLGCAQIALDRSWQSQQVLSPFSRLYWLDHGAGEVYQGERVLPLEPGYLHLIPCQTLNNYRCDNKMEQQYLHFTAEVMPGIDLLSLITSPLRVKVDNPEETAGWLGRILARHGETHPADVIERSGLLHLLLAPFFRVLDPAIFSSHIAAVDRFEPVLAFINDHLAESITLARMAAVMHLHPTYFSNLFAHTFGKSPVQYLRLKRVERAQWLLVSSAAPLSQVALEVGYDDVLYFSRVFKQTTGIPPARYRKLEDSLL